MSRYQNAGQNHNIKMANSVFGNVAKLKYFGTTPKLKMEAIRELRAD
jgi:hypothetical protein